MSSLSLAAVQREFIVVQIRRGSETEAQRPPGFGVFSATGGKASMIWLTQAASRA
jgi:hypothetical protein